MATDQAVPVPAGWYPDPYSVSEMRWWDGQSWTDSIHPPVEQAPGHPVPAPPAQAEESLVVEESPFHERGFTTETPANTFVEHTSPIQTTPETVNQIDDVPVITDPSGAALVSPPAVAATVDPFTLPPAELPDSLHIPPLVEPSSPEPTSSSLSTMSDPDISPPAPTNQVSPAEIAPIDLNSQAPSRSLSRREMRLRDKFAEDGAVTPPKLPSVGLTPTAHADTATTVASPAPFTASSTAAREPLQVVSTPVPDSSTPTAFDWLPGAGAGGLNSPPAPPPATSTSDFLTSPSSPLVTSPAATADPAGAALRPREGTEPTVSSGAWSQNPNGAGPAPRNSNRQTATRTATTSGWFIAIMPLLAAILSISAVKGQENYPRYVPAGIQWWMLVAAVLAVLYVVTVILAIADRRKLDWAGYNQPAHWAWSLLTAPIYLIVRTISVKRETGRNSALLWVWLLLIAAVVGAWFAAVYFAPELLKGYVLPFL